MHTRFSRRSLLPLVVGSVLLGFHLPAGATLLGLNDPLGNPSGGVGYAIWDSFTNGGTYPALVFDDALPGTGDEDLFIATLSSDGGGSVTGTGDRMYNGIAASSGVFNLSIEGTVTASIDTITLQIKMTPPDEATGLTRLTFFTVTLNGLGGTAVQTNSGTGELVGSQELGVVTYTWSGLDLDAGNSLDFSITSPASGHVSVDAIRVDASAVPEPSAVILIGVGVSVSLWVARRRRGGLG